MSFERDWVKQPRRSEILRSNNATHILARVIHVDCFMSRLQYVCSKRGKSAGGGLFRASRPASFERALPKRLNQLSHPKSGVPRKRPLMTTRAENSRVDRYGPNIRIATTYGSCNTDSKKRKDCVVSLLPHVLRLVSRSYSRPRLTIFSWEREYTPHTVTFRGEFPVVIIPKTSLKKKNELRGHIFERQETQPDG